MSILVIDIGSSSVRALLFDDQARPIPGAQVSRTYTFTTTPLGAATIDASELQGAVESCVDEILKHPAAVNVIAVGMDSLVGNLLGVNNRGEPLTPIFTYADIRSAEDVAILRDQVDVEAAHQRTGCIHHTAYQPGRLHWLRRTEPELFGKVALWTDFATFLYRRWFGDASCSYSVASWSGMLDRAALRWDRVWLDVLGMDEAAFPPLADIQAINVGLRT